MAERHYMLRLTRADFGTYKQETIWFPDYIAGKEDVCIERYHQYAAAIGFTIKEEREVYNGGCVYRNPADASEMLRFR
jgi:hypothetical protein